MAEYATKEEFNELKDRVTDLEIADRKFQARCYQEFAHIQRQLADHGNSLQNLEEGQKNLEEGQKNLEEGQTEIRNLLGQVIGLLKKEP